MGQLKAFYSRLTGDSRLLEQTQLLFRSGKKRKLSKYITYGVHRTAIEYQNCISVQKERVTAGIGGTKSYSSSRCVPSRLANMHGYEAMKR